ncbi:8-oxo-dGTP diphosphatase [Actinoplanes lutulentus]|uniref:8-oxo-dGTP diphosphatase n=1 Tax=Actinoplanes lutulentus TaxID=1287878 RepID=A0A327YYQ7_9ACTN|nr:NUDIX hydrolase [Actinoplanes lutulentus]MBB2942148.1 8-oxo-dGTP diphosphatase [Actinoplanes lutulentus]RAK26898.1 8-oxo-dGTP diphosphatase [Actinoplanes lutulentus]
MPDAEFAAGGVLHRPRPDGAEVCLVHRPRYDDWSLPKGKLADGEPALLGALREVEEETGTAGIPLLRLPDIDYTLADGRPKNVAYWLLQAPAESDGPVQDADEVDERVWLPLAEARERLTYPAEQELLDHVAALPPVTSVIALVRHAHAGERKKWNGRDALRPIDPEGAKQADRIAATLTSFRPRRLVAAPPLRCSQTLEPLAAALGAAPIILDAAFAEPSETTDLATRLSMARTRLADLRKAGRVVVCSQGKVMPQLLALLHGGEDHEEFKTRKGDGWLLTWSGERLLGASRL